MSGGWLVFLTYVLWGFLAAYWTIFSNVDPLFILSNRILWSLILCYLMLRCKGQASAIKETLKDKKQRRLLFWAGIVVTINWGSFIIAVMGGHILDASLAYYICPIFSVLLAFFVYGEKFRTMQWIAFILAMIGVCIPIIKYGKVPVFALTIAISFAVYGAIKKQVTVSGITSIFTETMWVLPLALIYMGLYGQHAGMESWQWWVLPTTGIVTSVPLILFAKGVQTTPLSLTGILMYVNPTIQFLIGVFVYHEPFTTMHAWMFAFVWTGVILFIVDGLRAHHRGATPIELNKGGQ